MAGAREEMEAATAVTVLPVMVDGTAATVLPYEVVVPYSNEATATWLFALTVP